MSLIQLEIPIKNGIEFTVPESYRIYIGQDLLVERTTHWDTNFYYVNERIVIKKVPVILIRIENTAKNIDLNTIDKQSIPKILDLPYISMDGKVIYPRIIREITAKTKLFSLVNILYIVV